MREQPELLTIGHSHHSLEHFLDLLIGAGVDAVADVRSWPRSRYASQFNAESLKASLSARSIGYVFLGHELGGRPEDPRLYDEEGHVLYDQVAQTPLFAEGLVRLLAGATRMTVAVMCAEEDPTHCHRRLLVTRVAVADFRATVRHVRGNGRIEPEPGFGITGATLFDDTLETPWRSTRSVSRKRAPSFSSAA